MLTDVDRAALERAMAMTLQEPDRVAQINAMLKDRPWEDVARFAAYHQQTRNLRLRPWEIPPMHGRDGSPENVKALRLANRLVAAGLSVYEPDPARALKEA